MIQKFERQWSIKNSDCPVDARCAGLRTEIYLDGIQVGTLLWRRVMLPDATIKVFHFWPAPCGPFEMDIVVEGGYAEEVVLGMLEGEYHCLRFWREWLAEYSLPNGGYVPPVYRSLVAEEYTRLTFVDVPPRSYGDGESAFRLLPFNGSEWGQEEEGDEEDIVERLMKEAQQTSFILAHRWIAHQMRHKNLLTIAYFAIGLEQASGIWARNQDMKVSWETIETFMDSRENFLDAATKAGIEEIDQGGPTLKQVFQLIENENDRSGLIALLKYIQASELV